MKKIFNAMIVAIFILLPCGNVFAAEQSEITEERIIYEIVDGEVMEHSDIPFSAESNLELSESEALALIESMPRNFTSECVINIEDVLNSPGITRAGDNFSGTYETEIATGTPGVYLNITVDYEGSKIDGKYKFTYALGHISVKKKYLETTWATAILTSTSNRYHSFEEDDTVIKISTDVNFEVYTTSFPQGVEYDEHHEIKFSVDDVL